MVRSSLPPLLLLLLACARGVAPGANQVASVSSAEELGIGTAHPSVIEAVASDGSWVVLCQARQDDSGDGEIELGVADHGVVWGDTLRPYFIHGAGPGESIDALVTYSSDGRWLVALRAGALSLFDGASGTWSVLEGADTRDDGAPSLAHRAASIDATGRLLLYFRGRDSLVLRDLASGRERVVVRSGVWRAWIEPGGHFARLDLVQRDSDGDGKVSWPAEETSLGSRTCRGPVMSATFAGWSGDAVDSVWLELASGHILDEGTAIVASVGAELLRRSPEGALLLGRTQIAPAACDAQVVGLSEDPPRVLFTCVGTDPYEPATRVTLAGPDFQKQTEATRARDDDWRNGINRYRLPVACWDETCIDFADGSVHEDLCAYNVATRHGSHCLFRGTPTTLVDILDGGRRELAASSSGAEVREGPMVIVGHQVFDLSRAQRLGVVSGRPLAVDRTGRALVSTSPFCVDFPLGPLRWTAPRP